MRRRGLGACALNGFASSLGGGANLVWCGTQDFSREETAGAGRCAPEKARLARAEAPRRPPT